MRVGYARVSTGEQEDALQQQISRLEKAGAQVIYSDIKTGRSSDKSAASAPYSDRKEFNKLISAVKRGTISEIIITRLDRLARSVVSMSKTIALLEEYKIKLTILDAPIEDISNPFSKFSINQMSALAQFESDLLQNRVKHGFNYFREQVKAPSKVPFGYRRHEEKFTLDNTIHACGKTHYAIALEIIDYMLEHKASLRSTCHWIQEVYGIKWSTRGFRSWLNNPVLRGHTCYNVRNNQDYPERWDVRYNTHTPLIDSEKDAQLKELMVENKRKWGVNRLQGDRGTSLLSGQIYCGCCDGKCYISRKDKDLLVCNKRNVYGKAYCSNKHATPLSLVVSRVDIELTKRATELRDFAFNETVADSPELMELKASLENLAKLPPNEFINDAIAGLKSRISQMQAKKNTPNFTLIDEWVAIFSDLTFFELLPHNDKCQLYRRFVDKVVIANREILQIELIDIF